MWYDRCKLSWRCYRGKWELKINWNFKALHFCIWCIYWLVGHRQDPGICSSDCPQGLQAFLKGRELFLMELWPASQEQMTSCNSCPRKSTRLYIWVASPEAEDVIWETVLFALGFSCSPHPFPFFSISLFTCSSGSPHCPDSRGAPPSVHKWHYLGVIQSTAASFITYTCCNYQPFHSFRISLS